MTTDPFEGLTPEQRAIAREVVATSWVSHDDVGDILENLVVNREDKRAVSDALAGARR